MNQILLTLLIFFGYSAASFSLDVEHSVVEEENGRLVLNSDAAAYLISAEFSSADEYFEARSKKGNKCYQSYDLEGKMPVLLYSKNMITLSYPMVYSMVSKSDNNKRVHGIIQCVVISKADSVSNGYKVYSKEQTSITCDDYVVPEFCK